MLLSPYFKKQVVAGHDFLVTRKGIIDRVILPTAMHGKFLSDINIYDRTIVEEKGHVVYVLADEFGFLGQIPLEANIFFVDNGIIFEIVEGELVLKGTNGELYSIDESGEIRYPDIDEKLHWTNHKELRERFSIVVGSNFGLRDKELIQSYMDNLVLGVYISLVTDFGDRKKDVLPMFLTRVEEYYEDLGLGIFSFINYKTDTELSEMDEEEVEAIDLTEVEEEDEYDEDSYDEFDDDDDNAF